MATSGDRTTRLLEAGMILSSELSLPALLQRLVELATALTGAGYGALGVIDEAGSGLADFVTTGITAEQRAAIGHLPEGRGILGALISDARPLRLREIRDDHRSVGFPPNHPSMHSFLGAPVRALGQVFGNLYLTEKQGAAEFTDDDEQTLTVLATQAGIAIANARLYQEARMRQRWLEATREISMAILAGDESAALIRLVATRARELINGDDATVVLPRDSGRLVVAVAVGAHATSLEGMDVPDAGSVSGDVIRSGRSVVLEDARNDSRTYQPMVASADMGPAIFVALSARGNPFGTLAVSRPPAARPFGRDEVQLLEAFADQAALAIEYGRAQQELHRLTVLEDRERIARELHDGVIQALFAVGLGVQGTAALLQDQVAAERLTAAVNEIDRVIGDLRNYIFGLRPGVLTGGGLANALGQLAHEFEARTGVTIAVDVDASLEAPLAGVANHLVQLTRESLSNVGRHAGAATCRVSLRRDNGRAVLEVDDDGRGFMMAHDHGGMGLANLRERSESIGAELTVTTRPDEGTIVRVSVPLAPG